MMVNRNVVVNFKKRVSFCHDSCFWKIIREPHHFLIFKILEVIAKLSGKSIKINARTFWGDKMVVVFPEVVSLHIYKYGFF